SNSATVSITVTPVNHAPIANDDTASTVEDTAVVITVLANDFDPDQGTSLTPVVVSGPTHGTTTVDADRTITYTPAADYTGPDSFTHKATDGALDSNIAVVSITVNAVKEAPGVIESLGVSGQLDSVQYSEDGSRAFVITKTPITATKPGRTTVAVVDT